VKYIFNCRANIFSIIVFYVVLIFIFWNKAAQSQIIDSAFYRWTVYEVQETELDYKKCYIVSHPVKSDSDHVFRQKPYLMITRFQKDRTEEVSISMGFEYKISSEIFVMIDENQYKFKTKNNIAWAKTTFEDITIIETMLNSGVLKVRSDSAIGTYAVDEYSLKGITRAYARMKEICR
jgi:hypothetical protein